MIYNTDGPVTFMYGKAYAVREQTNPVYRPDKIPEGILISERALARKPRVKCFVFPLKPIEVP